jgi:preprotein translocase subunit SecE
MQQKTNDILSKLFLAALAGAALAQLFFWFTARGTNIWLVAAATLFAFVYLWRNGHLLRFANYIKETREELKKCTWPTWEELRGSTVVVMISILLLGAFTVGVDLVLLLVVRTLTQ